MAFRTDRAQGLSTAQKMMSWSRAKLSPSGSQIELSDSSIRKLEAVAALVDSR